MSENEGANYPPKNVLWKLVTVYATIILVVVAIFITLRNLPIISGVVPH